MPKKKAPPRPPATRGSQVERDSPNDAVDWTALVESIREETDGRDLAQRLLEIGQTMTTTAAHMFLVGEYLLEKKKGIPHGEFTAWIEAQGLAQRTGRKYMAFARRIARWTNQNGTRVPFSALTALVQGETPERAAAQMGEADDETPAAVEEPESADGGRADTAEEAPPTEPEQPVPEDSDPALDEAPDESDKVAEEPDEPVDDSDVIISDGEDHAEDHDLVSIVDQFADALADLAETAVEQMDRTEIRQLAEAMKRAQVALAVTGEQAVRRTKVLNEAGMQEAS